VGEYGFPYLDAAQLHLADRADYVARKKLLSVHKIHGRVAPVNPQNSISVLVFGEFA
jgi:hypothetical protein